MNIYILGFSVTWVSYLVYIHLQTSPKNEVEKNHGDDKRDQFGPNSFKKLAFANQ